MGMGTLKLLASWGFVIVLVQPICDFLVIPPLLTKIAYQPIQQLLIGGIWCNPKIGKTNFYGEGKKYVCCVI
jgi:hypothetical protein